MFIDTNTLAIEFDLDGIGVVEVSRPRFEKTMVKEVIKNFPPELSYIARTVDKRLDPSLVLEGVKSICVGIISYASPNIPQSKIDRGKGIIARFASFKDYHKSVGTRMKRLARYLESFGGKTKWYVDTGPVLEKSWAYAAGLGFIGKNSLFISPSLGSFVFIGVILTDLELEATPPNQQGNCGTCMACQNACPTNALLVPYTVDVKKCLAHWTVTAKSKIPQSIAMPNLLYGCEICQDVCPYNHNKPMNKRKEFTPKEDIRLMDLDMICNMDEKTFESLFGDTPIRRRGLSGLKTTAMRIINPKY